MLSSLRTVPMVALAALLWGAAGALADETVTRIDGASYSGEIVDVSEDAVEIESSWPPVGRVRVLAGDVRPRSWWQLQTIRIGDDAAKRIALAEWAEAESLPIHALTEYRKVKTDRRFAERAQAAIRRIERSVATRLFDQGEALVRAGRPGAAKRYFDIIVRCYAATEAATVARKQLDQVERTLALEKRRRGMARVVAATQRSSRRAEADWVADVAAIQKEVELADKRRSRASRHPRRVRDSRTLERSRAHLEQAWKLAERLAPPPDGSRASEVKKVRDDVRQRLVETYVSLADSALRRGAVNTAEDWCDAACAIDPAGKKRLGLHARVIDALLLSGWYRVPHGGR